MKAGAGGGDRKRTGEWRAVARLEAEKETTTPKVPERRLELRGSEPLSVDPRAEDRDKDGREDLVFLAHRAGEKLFIDYAGPTVPIVNPDTGEMRRAHIFVAVLGASNYTYCLLYTSPSPRDRTRSRMPSSA